MSFQTGDIILVDGIYPRDICSSYPALSVAANDHCVRFIDPGTYAHNPDKMDIWIPDKCRVVTLDDLTDEQIRLVTLWRLKHG